MQHIIRYLSHPQVEIDPSKLVQDWSLNAEGTKRVIALANSNALRGTTLIVSSAEKKALETAKPLVSILGCDFQIRTLMHENDRSSTGFLPPEEFETVADQFFKHPQKSVMGWETAHAAQMRIVNEVHECLNISTQGDVLFVGHGGVGTLLFCHLCDLPISRKYDQGSGGGGCFYEFLNLESKPTSGWRPMEELYKNTSNPTEKSPVQ